jgi:hypothetical protein
MAAQRSKTRTGRAKTVSAAAPIVSAEGPRATPEETLVAIFAELPEALRPSGGEPEVVRRNRRERARRRLLEALASRGPHPVPEARWDEVRVLARRWAQKDFGDAFAEAAEFEIRCAEEREVLDAKNETARLAAAERAYLRGVVERYGRIEIRGLQLSARVHQDLEIAYVPLHVEETAPPVTEKHKGVRRQHKILFEGAEEDAFFRAMLRSRVPVASAVAQHPRLLVVGGPGSGKSTLVAYFATRAARGELASELGWERERVPFVVPVRALREAPVTVASLAVAAGAEPWLFETSLRSGRALLMIDGLDEARREVAPALLPALASILEEHEGTRLLVTSRPDGAPSGKPAPADCARVELTAMSREEVSTFIEKWCLAAEQSVGKADAVARADATNAAQDLEERVRSRRPIEKLAQTPLLCSVICIVHRFLGQQIPERRVVLYEAITNALLYEWDRAKFSEGTVIGNLDAAAKRALLAPLARVMHEAKVAELPEEDVVRRFAEQLPALGRPAQEAAALVAEIRDRNGVLVERAPGVFGFSHLTFQEFLAAQDMVRERAYEQLLEHYRDPWWHEVITLAAGFPSADAAGIVRGLLDRDGNDVAEGTMLAAQCAETAIELPVPVRERIKQRVAKLVPPRVPRDYEALSKLGDLAGPVLLRGLDHADADGKVSILFALTQIGYEPAIGQVGKLLGDSARTARPTIFPHNAGKLPPGMTVAMAAAIAARFLVAVSDSAFSVVLGAMGDAHLSTIIFFQPDNVLDKANNEVTRERFRALLRRYDETHPTPTSSSPRPKRAARSG